MITGTPSLANLWLLGFGLKMVHIGGVLSDKVYLWAEVLSDKVYL